MNIRIDPGAGFCPGVRRVVRLAEEAVSQGPVTSLGELLHNPVETARLRDAGLVCSPSIESSPESARAVLFRAHGEPPESYLKARQRSLTIIDGTCPVVARLQARIRKVASDEPEARILISGKPDHPEVIGLAGQAPGIIILPGPGLPHDLPKTSRIHLFAQTTLDPAKFDHTVQLLRDAIISSGRDPEKVLVVHRSLCGQVTGRMPALRKFARTVDLILFVGGRNSSNAKALFGVCLEENPNSQFIEGPDEIDPSWLISCHEIGVTGATSTPPWLLEQVANAIKQLRT